MTNDKWFYLPEHCTFVEIDDNCSIFNSQVRDQNIVAMCKEMGIAVTHEHSHTLYNLEK